MEGLKALGDAAVKRGDHASAVKAYTDALACGDGEVATARHVVLSNRAAAHLALRDGAAAVADASRCVELAPLWAKGHFRLGQAREAVGATEDDAVTAWRAYARAAELEPSNKDFAAAAERSRRTAAAAESAAAEAAHDFRDCYVAAVRVATPPTHATPLLTEVTRKWTASALVAVQAVEGAGRGLVATAAIAAGSLIVEEPVMAWYPPFADAFGGCIPRMLHLSPWFTAAAHAHGRLRGVELLDSVLFQMAPFSLPVPAPGTSAPTCPSTVLPNTPLRRMELHMRVARANALAGCVDDSSADRDGHTMSLLTALASMMNHSCAPTARYTAAWNAKLDCPTVRVYAIADLPVGAAITISYVDPAAAKAERQRQLLRYGFRCTCIRCAAPWDDTIVFACPTCGSGRLFGGAPACHDCNAPVPTSSPVPGTTLPPVPFTLSLPAQKGRRLYGESPPGWQEAALGSGEVAAAASGADSDGPALRLHLTDGVRLGAVYQQLGAVWGECHKDPALALRVYAAVLPAMQAATGQWNAYLTQAHLLAAHVASVAGEVEVAKRWYAAAADGYQREYGPTDPVAALVRTLTSSPPTTRGQVEKVEVQRVRLGAWTARWRMPPRVVEMLQRPLRGDCAVAVGSMPAEQRVVHDQLLAMSAAVQAPVEVWDSASAATPTSAHAAAVGGAGGAGAP